MLISIFLVILAVILLYYGAEISLETSEGIGKKLGMSPLLVGMVLIGFGTSLPELFVGHIAGMRGEPDIAVGTLVGSNIANMFLILGICGLISKLDIVSENLREHLWVHLLLGIVLSVVLTYARIDFKSAILLLSVIFVYLVFIYKDLKREHLTEEVETDLDSGKANLTYLKLIVGFGMLYLGGELLVKSGSELAKFVGISNYVISAIFIAFGTSFPELVTSILAAVKKKDTDLIIGNIVGSNIFNCAFILGSMGIYNFSIENNFFYEIISLNIGAIIFVILAYTTKIFSKVSSTIFLSSYSVMVLHWLNVF